MKAVLRFDGACKGNPGPAAGGAVLEVQEETVICHGKPFTGTNNEAEYQGLIVGLRRAIELGVTDLTVFGDSNLVVNQVNGEWGIHRPHLRLLREQAKRLLNRIPTWSLAWVPREQNAAADSAANAALLT